MIWLVTGGCGFVGANLVAALSARGDEVVALDDLSRQGARENLAWLRQRHGDKWSFVEADTRNTEAITRVIRDLRPNAICHMAAQVAMTTSFENPRRDFEINALGTFNVLEAVRLHAPAAIVLYPSSNKAYGSLEEIAYEEQPTRYVAPAYPQGFAEDMPLDGHTPYGCSKLAAEQYVRDYHRTFGVRTVVFRHSSIYGGHQYPTFHQGWVSWFASRALLAGNPDTEPFTIAGNGKQVRDLLHVDDLVALYLGAAEGIDRIAGEIFNIGGGMSNSYSLLELFAELERQTGHKLRYRATEMRMGDQKVFVCDLAKIHRLLGWSPKVSKEQGVARLLAWLREVGHGE